ncbi:MAG: SixA phosphatase family protein [Actinomycetota bacterium]
MTVYLVRHASAGTRNHTDPSDRSRILDESGTLQAEQLAGWLRHEDIRRIASSPVRRCVQTVEPLAKVLDLTVTPDERLGEGSDLESAWLALTTAARSRGHSVLCSHGDLIPELISRLRRRGMQVPGRSGCSKGSTWVLQHWNGECFATGLYTPVKV